MGCSFADNYNDVTLFSKIEVDGKFQDMMYFKI